MPDTADGRLRTAPVSSSSRKPCRLIAAIVATAALVTPALADDNAAIPNFMPDVRTGWVAGVPDSDIPIGDDFIQPPSGPGPVTYDRAHPYLDNRAARKLGKR